MERFPGWLHSAGVSVPKDSGIIWMHIPVSPSVLSQALIVLLVYTESLLMCALEVVCVLPLACTMHLLLFKLMVVQKGIKRLSQSSNLA